MTFSKESALVLGIDVGTSGVRAVLMNSKFDVVSQSSSLMTDFILITEALLFGGSL